jgi:hypothetical protein
MTSKYFGEFLVEKGVITQDNLVDALVEQIAATPPLCQLIHQKKILGTSKIFEAFRYQQDKQVEFMSACVALGFWNKDVQDKVSSALDEIRKPLGHILVSKGLLDLKKLTTMLDEFLSQLSIKETTTKNEVVSSQPVEVAPVEEILEKTVESSSPILQDLVETYQPGILSELEETFDERKRKMMRVAFSLIKDNAGVDKAICKKLMLDIMKIVRSLNGLLGLLGLDKLSELLMSTEEYLNNVNSLVEDRSQIDLINDTEILIKAIDLAWSLRSSTITNANERVFFSEKKNYTDYDHVLGQLRKKV